jgi:hypothetical protein
MVAPIGCRDRFLTCQVVIPDLIGNPVTITPVSFLQMRNHLNAIASGEAAPTM